MPGAEKGATRVDGRYVQGGFQAQGYGLKGAALTRGKPRKTRRGIHA